ncbi:homeodomain-like protein [Tanacetum coccineum]
MIEARSLVDKSQRKSLDKSHDGLEAKRSGLEAKRSGLEAKRSGLEAKRSGLEAKRSGLEAKRSGLEAKRSGLEAKRSGLEAKRSEYSKEEEAKAMAETMEQYMSKTRTDYGSGVARPKIEEKDSFELKGQFFKELRENTFSGLDNEDANEHIEKVLEIVDLFHVPNITMDQLMLRVFPISLTGAASRWLRIEPTGSIKTWEDLKRGNFVLTMVLDVPTRTDSLTQGGYAGCSTKTRKKVLESSDGTGCYTCTLNNLGQDQKVNENVFAAQSGGYRATTPGFYQRNNANPSYQERRKSMEDTLSKFMGELAKRHEENCNLIKEIQASIDAAIIKTVKYPKGIAEKVLVGIGKFTFPIDFIILDMPEDINVTLILKRSFLSTARAKINVYKRKITLRVGEENIIFKSVKPANSIIKRVYMLSLRERMELDLEARLMGETLMLNRSLNPFSEDYIELNDLNEPFELKRNQEDDLMPTIEEGEIIEEFRTRNDDLDTRIDDYPSYCDNVKKIYIDCAHNLKFSCMIGFEFTHANFFPLLYVSVMSRKIHNSIMKNRMVYKGNNVVRALMNVPIFVGTFYVMTDFAVLEDMDAYLDNEMSDVIFGEPFVRDAGIKTKRFDSMITIYNGNDDVTYQMVRSYPRFKNHTNEQCNKIPPLLKVSEKDIRNGISHAYKKLKGFYKGVLNLGPNYIQDAKMEEWLIHGHISVHELK